MGKALNAGYLRKTEKLVFKTADLYTSYVFKMHNDFVLLLIIFS